MSTAKESPPPLTVPACDCGPLSAMMSGMLRLGQSGAMDGVLLNSRHFYQTDFTRALLVMQNDAVANKAQQENLRGSHWGVMNETGNYPGQAWLWLDTMLYQIPPYTTAWAANTDALVLTAVALGIVGMGISLDALSHGDLSQLGIGIPSLFIGLWWAGRDLGRSILAAKTRSAPPPTASS